MADNTETTGTQEQPLIITKMTVKTIGCKPKDRSEDASVRLPLCRIYGRASGVKHGEATSGDPWTAIVGKFEAVNLQNMKFFAATKLFLPGGIHEMLEAPFIEAEKNDTEIEGIDFAFEIQSFAASNPQGYSYAALPLLRPKVSDDLERLRVEVLKSITAPATQQIAAPAPPAPAPTTKNAPPARKR